MSPGSLAMGKYRGVFWAILARQMKKRSWYASGGNYVLSSETVPWTLAWSVFGLWLTWEWSNIFVCVCNSAIVLRQISEAAHFQRRELPFLSESFSHSRTDFRSEATSTPSHATGLFFFSAQFKTRWKFKKSLLTAKFVTSKLFLVAVLSKGGGSEMGEGVEQ